MTPAEWLNCTDLGDLLRFAQARMTPRQLRLFAAACCRRVWHYIEDERSRWALVVAEKFADGLADERTRRVAEIGAQTATTAASWSVEHGSPEAHAARAVHQVVKIGDESFLRAASCVENAVAAQAYRLHPACPAVAVRTATQAGVRAAQSRLLRHILGDPFVGEVPLPAVSPLVRSWRLLVYDQDRSAVAPLHDALVEAGLEFMAMHFGDRAERHPKGCRVLDGLLGRSSR